MTTKKIKKRTLGLRLQYQSDLGKTSSVKFVKTDGLRRLKITDLEDHLFSYEFRKGKSFKWYYYSAEGCAFDLSRPGNFAYAKMEENKFGSNLSNVKTLNPRQAKSDLNQELEKVSRVFIAVLQKRDIKVVTQSVYTTPVGKKKKSKIFTKTRIAKKDFKPCKYAYSKKGSFEKTGIPEKRMDDSIFECKVEDNKKFVEEKFEGKAKYLAPEGPKSENKWGQIECKCGVTKKESKISSLRNIRFTNIKFHSHFVRCSIFNLVKGSSATKIMRQKKLSTFFKEVKKPAKRKIVKVESLP